MSNRVAVGLRAFILFALLGSSALAQNTVSVQTQTVVEAASSVPIASVWGNRDTSASISPEPDTPAPALTRVFINNVCTSSSGTGCETISSGQVSTANTYSGSQVYTFVWEIGYGTGEIATQGGTQIASAYLESKSGVCQSGSNYTINCPTGSSIVGWRYVWDNGYYLNQGFGEHFAAQDTSSVSPYSTYSASLTIQYNQ
jgi:hypothetical protein